jgi:exopolysaccharide biosynthesis WecB/TagA/CpsF family protein
MSNSTLDQGEDSPGGDFGRVAVGQVRHELARESNAAATGACALASSPTLRMPAGLIETQEIGDSVALRNGTVIEVDNFDLASFTKIAARHDQRRYTFAVTPNVDHLIRYHEDATFRNYYRAAGYVLMDSRVVRKLVRLVHGLSLPICTGSDLTVTLLSQVAAPTDRIVMLGGTAQQAEQLAALYGLKDLRHHNPSMGFAGNPAEVERCLQFIEGASPFRFCFLAVGSPQQEMIAHQLKARGIARGFAICVGASVNYITGSERRAPQWMQQLALEWLYRLIQDPRRLARRYLLRGPRIFRYLFRARIVLRESRPEQP